MSDLLSASAFWERFKTVEVGKIHDVAFHPYEDCGPSTTIRMERVLNHPPTIKVYAPTPSGRSVEVSERQFNILYHPFFFSCDSLTNGLEDAYDMLSEVERLGGKCEVTFINGLGVAEKFYLTHSKSTDRFTVWDEDNDFLFTGSEEFTRENFQPHHTFYVRKLKKGELGG
jgi:hypothetical protein